MPLVEHSLLSAGKLIRTRSAANGHSTADAEEKTRQEDTFIRVSTKNLCTLSRQLATLLRAGMPLSHALSALVEQLQGEPLAEVVKHIAESVNAGSTFADALKRQPKVFSALFVNMVAAGEMSGTLEDVLLRLADMLEKRLNLAAKVKSAIAYPLMMVVVALAVVIFLLSFVVPSITEVFIEMNRALPWPTRLLMSISAFTEKYLLLVAIAICAGCYGIRLWLRTKEGRLFMDRAKLRLPLFGKLLLKLEIARLTRMLGILLISGIPILGALEIARSVIQNSFIAKAIGSVKDLVGKGDNIAAAIRKTGLFPPIVFHITATGQVGGNVEAAFIDIADMYDSEVDRQAKTLVSLLEPAILVVMGAIIGFIVMAVLLPIFEINQAF